MISVNIESEIVKRVDQFNKKYLAKTDCKYIPQIKGNFIYLLRTINQEQEVENICRLKYSGDLEDLDFAIFKYSSEKYDPNELFFDGSELVDGTLEGAMKAGLEAYPI